ncbi:piggyBac transposable element-derived protein 3-like [Parasteatoda tepidariorum]|uniref:piggyBac transposable element-derived protein 3-like n=1 Tax=Parasteatoda tepidariorum TaxID=114398 RepID=UPI001C71AE98|nr:piggyBac transposable element-derived protein 3-like [Parasteatoda tepidariorum]
MARWFLTVQQALDYMETLESDEFSGNECSITCLPPDPSKVTDEKDFQENDLDDVLPVDVCGEIELNVKLNKTRNASRKKTSLKKKKRSLPENYSSSDEDDLPTIENKQVKPKKIAKMRKSVSVITNDTGTQNKKKSKRKFYNWDKADKMDSIQSEKTPLLEEINPELAGKTPYELFIMYFYYDILNLIKEETLRYAKQNNNYAFSLSEKSLDVFLGISLFSGYHSLLQEDLYWRNAEDCNLPFMQNAMSRQKFREIKKCIHLCNNDTIDISDKLAKVSCLIEMFCNKLQQFGTFSEYLSIDEEMIPYTERYSAKMYMRGKFIKFGYKLWFLVSSQGYPYNLQVYVGKEASAECNTPLGTRVVLDLIECIENSRRHKVYVDNFFNSLTLLEEMRKRGFRITETVRQNRLQDCPLQDSKDLVKKERGTSVCITTKSVSVVKWKDNKNVCLASNFEGMEPIRQAKRWCQKFRREIDLPQPGIVAFLTDF